MGIKIKKRKLTNKKFSLQYGGSVKGPKPDFTKTHSTTNIGATARFGKKAKSVAGDALSVTKTGVKYAGLGVAAVVASPVIIPYLAVKHGAKPVAKGIATAAISAPLAITSGAVAGTAKATSAILKTALWSAPVSAVQSVREKLARKNLTQKLGGLNMVERTRKLSKYSTEQEKLAQSRTNAYKALEKQYEGKISKAKTDADIAKLEEAQTKATEKLTSKHNSEAAKLLKRVIKSSNKSNKSLKRNSTINNATRKLANGKNKTGSKNTLSTLLESSKTNLQKTYEEKKQAFQQTVEQQKTDLDLNTKKTALETQKNSLDSARQKSKESLDQSKKFFDVAEEMRTSIKREDYATAGEFRKQQLSLEKASREAKAKYLAQSQLYKKESSNHMDQEKNLLKEEQNLLKLEPKNLDYYEGKYLQRKEAANLAREKRSIGRQFRKIGQAAVKGFSWGAKQAEKTGIVYKVGNKAAELSERLKPAPIVNTRQKSNYSFREKYLPSTSAGLTPFTSSQKKVENIYDTLFGKDDVNKKTTKELDDEINAKQAEVAKYKGDPAKYNEYLKLQSEIKSLSDNKTTRLNLMKQARITTADYTTTNSFNKYKGNFKNDTQITSILDKAVTPKQKTDELNEIKNNYLDQIKAQPKNLDLLNKYRDIKGLIKYYQSQTLQNAIKTEINTATSSAI